jgi:hypothetical protein
MASGAMEPLANANSAPATPHDRAGQREARPLHADHVDADRRSDAQWRITARTQRIAEGETEHRAAGTATPADHVQASVSR